MSYETATAITAVFGIIMYWLMANNWQFNFNSRTKFNPVQMLLTWLTFFLIPAIYQLAIEFAGAEASPIADVATILTLLYQVSIYILYFMSAYFVILFVYNALMYLGKTAETKKK